MDEIGVVDVAAISKEVNSIDNKRNSSNTKRSEKDGYSIGKYASGNSIAAAVRKFKSKFLTLYKNTALFTKKG